MFRYVHSWFEWLPVCNCDFFKLVSVWCNCRAPYCFIIGRRVALQAVICWWTVQVTLKALHKKPQGLFRTNCYKLSWHRMITSLIQPLLKRISSLNIATMANQTLLGTSWYIRTREAAQKVHQTDSQRAVLTISTAYLVSALNYVIDQLVGCRQRHKQHYNSI